MTALYAFDTETTGLESKSGDRIIELAFYEITRAPNPRTFHRYINPGDRVVNKEAYEVHGLSNEFLKDKPTFEEIVPDLLAFLNDTSGLVIHNAAFDLEFMNDEFSRAGVIWTPPTIIDTYKEARKAFPSSRHSLDALCNRFNVDLTVRAKHSALVDTQLLAQVYIAWFGQASLDLATTKNAAMPEQTLEAVSFNQTLVDFPSNVSENPPARAWDEFFRNHSL